MIQKTTFKQTKGEIKMSKQKVSELSQEERAALIKEANALGINGVFDNFNVETLLNKIAEKKAEKEQEQKTNDEENKNQNSENNPDENAQKADEKTEEENQENNEDAKTVNEQCDGETVQLPRNEVKEADCEQRAKDGNEEFSSEVPFNANKQEYKICHICRSKVVNGKCTGCGFEGR